MKKLLLVLASVSILSPAFAASGALDGRYYCRSVGQIEEERVQCISFVDGIATDKFFDEVSASVVAPYTVNGDHVTFGSSEFVLSDNKGALTVVSSTGDASPGIVFYLFTGSN